MEDNSITQPIVEGTQENEVKLETQPISGKTEQKIEDIKKYSQEDLDSEMRKTRLATEKDAKKKLLAQLGLTLEDEEKLAVFKKAYEDSLSDEEKRATEITNLQAEKTKLINDLEEKDYTIKALIEITGKQESDVEKIVKMAKGLKNDDNTIEDAIKEVVSMINVEQPKPNNPNMPTSEPLQQPSTKVTVDTQDNPFKAGQINLTKQGQLLRTNPELAKRLAAEAGVNLKI